MNEPTDTMDARYLSIIDEVRSVSPKLRSVTQAWANFHKECSWDTKIAIKCLADDWHGTYVSSGIIFRTEEDKVWWMLRWT